MAGRTFIDRMFSDEVKSLRQEKPKREPKPKTKKQSSNHVSFCIKLLVPRDDAVIAKLRSEKNKTDYIRKLIEKDLGE